MEMVPILNTINLFLMDGVDALTVMYYNEYDQIINSGVNEDELSTFFFSRYGFDIPEDGLYCLDKTYAGKKDMLGKFVNATLKGWEYAAQHKDYTIDLVVTEMNKAHLPSNEAHQRWMLDKVLELITPGSKDTRKGLLLKNDFDSALQILKSGPTSEFKDIELSLESFYKPLAD